MAQIAGLRYTYETALNPNQPEIRLLHILPGEESSDIECTIETACLTHDPIYSCLSYTWGDPREDSAIRLNSLSFAVTKSVLIALRYLRNDRDIITIWIDAICINQKDSSEKASQVRQMAEIYMKSKNVIIWLGEEADDSSCAMQIIQSIDRRWASRTSQSREGFRTAAQHLNDRVLQAISKLLKRPWWCRAWVIQEATCANETLVKCGRETTDFTAFVATVNCLGYHVLETSLQHHSAPDMLHLQRVFALDQLKLERARANYRPNMLDILDRFRTCKASDPRDKIFAFAALATGTERETINPDYTIPVNIVYMKFVYAFIRSAKNLNILGHCQDYIQTIKSWSSFRSIGQNIIPSTPLPSWTPDWTVMLETTSFAKHEEPEDSRAARLYKATTSFAPSVRLIENENTLIVRGCVFDRVSCLVPESISLPLSTRMQSWHKWAMDHRGDTNLLAGLLHDAFLHTIVADVGQLEGRWSRGFSADWPLQNEPNDINESFNMYSTIRMAVHSRRLFISGKGFLGLARFDVRKHDEICLLHGGLVAYILRQVGDAYQFIGECYIYGLMDGEGMRYPHIWKDFVLR